MNFESMSTVIDIYDVYILQLKLETKSRVWLETSVWVRISRQRASGEQSSAVILNSFHFFSDRELSRSRYLSYCRTARYDVTFAGDPIYEPQLVCWHTDSRVDEMCCRSTVKLIDPVRSAKRGACPRTHVTSMLHIANEMKTWKGNSEYSCSYIVHIPGLRLSVESSQTDPSHTV